MVNPPFLAFPCPVKCRQDLFHWGRLHPVSPRRLVTASFSSASNLQRAARPHAFTQLLVNLNGCTNDLAGEIVCAHRTTLRQLDVFRRSRRLLFPGRRLPAIALAQARRAGLPAREKPSSSVASVLVGRASVLVGRASVLVGRASVQWGGPLCSGAGLCARQG